MTGWLCTRRMIAITRWVVVLELLAGGMYFTAIRPLQAQPVADQMPVIVERVTDLRARMDAHEKIIHMTTTDLAVLKDNMIEVKWLGRSVAGAVMGQVLIAWLGARTRGRRREDPE